MVPRPRHRQISGQDPHHGSSNSSYSLANFFSWIEGEEGGSGDGGSGGGGGPGGGGGGVQTSAIVREWGVSGTTLEQVFLQLCVSNTEVKPP